MIFTTFSHSPTMFGLKVRSHTLISYSILSTFLAHSHLYFTYYRSLVYKLVRTELIQTFNYKFTGAIPPRSIVISIMFSFSFIMILFYSLICWQQSNLLLSSRYTLMSMFVNVNENNILWSAKHVSSNEIQLHSYWTLFSSTSRTTISIPLVIKNRSIRLILYKVFWYDIIWYCSE